MNTSDNPARDPVVALAIDGGYAPWASVVIRSCLLVQPEASFSFEILHDGSVGSEDGRRFERLVSGTKSEVRLHAFDRRRIDRLPATLDFGPIVWLRFFLPEVLGDRERALYLDSDTLVTDRLVDLWQTPLDGAPLAAVANVVEPAARPHLSELGLTYPGEFFNSGVLLLDLAAFRREDETGHLLAYATANAKTLKWPDQDALNVVFRDRWLSLHPRWNAQNSLWTWRAWAVEVFGEELVLEATQSPAIRHFEGPYLAKPWHFLCSVPGCTEYRKVLAETPWSGVGLHDMTVATRLIRALPQGQHLAAYKKLFRARELRSKLIRAGSERIVRRHE